MDGNELTIQKNGFHFRGNVVTVSLTLTCLYHALLLKS